MREYAIRITCKTDCSNYLSCLYDGKIIETTTKFNCQDFTQDGFIHDGFEQINLDNNKNQ